MFSSSFQKSHSATVFLTSFVVKTLRTTFIYKAQLIFAMKKEVVLALVVLLVMPSVNAAYANITFVDFTEWDNIRDPDVAGGPSCINEAISSLTPWTECHEILRTKASLTQCVSGSESGTLLAFTIRKPSSATGLGARYGYFIFTGGMNIRCALNNNHLALASTQSLADSTPTPTRPVSTCPPSANSFMVSDPGCGSFIHAVYIPARLFREGVNSFGCEILGSNGCTGSGPVGFTLGHFSFEIEGDHSELACVGHNADPARLARMWREDLFDKGTACCGDDKHDFSVVIDGATGDNGRVEVNPSTGKRSLLCYKDPDASSDDEWAWHDASVDGGEAFIIKPLPSVAPVPIGIPLGVAERDYVSNKEEWFLCEQASAGQNLPNPSTLRAYDQARAAKFTCAGQGNQYRWMECCDPAAQAATNERACENDVLHDRLVSPGGAATSITSFVPTTSSASGDITETFERAGDLLRIEKNPSTGSKKLDITDWTSFSELHLIYKVSSHFDVIIQIFSGSNRLIYSENLNAFVEAVDTPRLDDFMTAQISLSQLIPQPHIPPSLSQNSDIGRVDLRFVPKGDASLPRNNVFTLRAAYLVPSGGTARYCTNARYAQRSLESSWISDLDDTSSGAPIGSVAGEPAGKSACNALGAFGWTGRKCCGDDGREFYSDTEAGCWNGDTVDDSTTMLVEFDDSQQHVYNCPSGQCAYPSNYLNVPTNKYPILYDVISDKEKTAATNVPQQILFSNNFFGCMRSNIQAMNPSGVTVTDVPLCSTKGTQNPFICSILDKGWEPVQSTAPQHVKTVIPGVNVLKNPRFDE